MNLGNLTFVKLSKNFNKKGISSIKNQLKGVYSPCFPPSLYNLPETNCKIICDIISKLCIVFPDIMKLLINAPVLGSRNIGPNNLQKKNFAIKAFSSIVDILGNFFLINNNIILHKHFIE